MRNCYVLSRGRHLYPIQNTQAMLTEYVWEWIVLTKFLPKGTAKHIMQLHDHIEQLCYDDFSKHRLLIPGIIDTSGETVKIQELVSHLYLLAMPLQ